MENEYSRMKQELRNSLPKCDDGEPIHIAEIYDDELDQYDDIEDWMPDELIDRLIEYWGLREDAINYQVACVLENED